MSKKYKRIVVKLGTSVLTGGTTRLNRAGMVNLVQQCAQLQANGHEILICSSGAIAVGRERMGYANTPLSVTEKQLLAAVGQSRLMRVWESLFDIFEIKVGQILLTREDVINRNRYLNARDTLQALLAAGIVPIVNENDAVATDEIKVGDNDNLSAMVAVLAGADLLLLLTDQSGLYTADPRTDVAARLLDEVAVIDARIRAIAGGSVSGLGVGGMQTKLDSAETATRAGIDTIIAAGAEPNVITRLVNGEALGTKFPASASSPGQHKRWILAGRQKGAYLVVDTGAERALVVNGSSLLPVGIDAVKGIFERGDTISVQSQAGKELARGIVRYSSLELAKLKGKNSAEIEVVLGYSYGDVAIHRRDLIVL